MQNTFCALWRTHVSRWTALSMIFGSAFLIAGCSSAPSGGALGAEDDHSASVADGPSSARTVESGDLTSGSKRAVDSSTQSWSSGSQGPNISAERVRLVTDVILREAAAVGLGDIHGISVQSESPKASLAVTTVTRNGARQVLAVTVVRDANAWKVTNVDTLPDLQDIR